MCQGPYAAYGVSGIIFLLDTQHYNFENGVWSEWNHHPLRYTTLQFQRKWRSGSQQIWGRGTNTFGEFMALRILMKATMDLGLKHLQIFGDSDLVISSMNGQIIHLPSLAVSFRHIKVHFDSLIFTHIFHEHNCLADAFSKEG